MNPLFGFDLGGTSLKAVAITPDGQILSQQQTPTRDDWPHQAKILFNQMVGDHGPPASTGACAPGIAHPDSTTIWWMQGRQEDVQGFDWTAHLGSSTPVPVLNDAQAALVAEAAFGAAKGARDAVLLTLGTGVGGAAIVAGKLLKGHLGRAGHFGHMSLDPQGPPDLVRTPGSLEDAIGEATLAARAQSRFTSTHDLLQAAALGDPLAQGVWQNAVQALGAAIVSLANALDPEIVVLGGGVAGAGPALFDPLARYLDQYEWRPHGQALTLRPATLGAYAGAIGAAAYSATSPSP